jgi:hypothetical protein
MACWSIGGMLQGTRVESATGLLHSIVGEGR